MDFTPEENTAAIRDMVERFVQAEITPVMADYEERHAFPRPVIEKMGAAGFFGAVFPEALGGTAIGFAALATMAEELSRLAPEFGYAMNMQCMTCPLTILNWGTSEQIERFVPDLIAGRKIGMFALTESGGGSDAAGAMQTTARRRGDVYLLNGSKMWITFSNETDAGLLFAKTDPAAGARGVTAFIVEPKQASGYRADPIDIPTLSRSLRSCAVFLDDFEVPVENRLGDEGEGFKIAMNALEFGRLNVSARLTGLAQGCYDAARDYARERVIRGQPIARYQMVQHLVADMAVNIEAARLLTQRTAWTMDQGAAANRAASQSKYFASIAANHAAQSAAEIFGGYALAADYPIAKRRAYINMLNVGEGAPAVQRILIAEDALGYKDANRGPRPLGRQ